MKKSLFLLPILLVAASLVRAAGLAEPNVILMVLETDGTPLLYNLFQDMEEKRDLAQSENNLVRELTAKLNARATQMPEKGQKTMSRLEMPDDHVQKIIND